MKHLLLGALLTASAGAHATMVYIDGGGERDAPVRVSCDEFLSSLETARQQRVASLMLRRQVSDAYQAQPHVFTHELLLQTIARPGAALEDQLREALAKVRQRVRRDGGTGYGGYQSPYGGRRPRI